MSIDRENLDKWKHDFNSNSNNLVMQNIISSNSSLSTFNSSFLTSLTFLIFLSFFTFFSFFDSLTSSTNSFKFSLLFNNLFRTGPTLLLLYLNISCFTVSIFFYNLIKIILN